MNLMPALLTLLFLNLPQKPTAPTPNVDRARADAATFARVGGMSGRIIPAPGHCVLVELMGYDNARFDSRFSNQNGEFVLQGGEIQGRSYIRVELGYGREFEYEFRLGRGGPMIINIRADEIKRTIVDTKAQTATGLSVSFAGLEAPKEAALDMDRARDLFAKKKYDKAAEALREALQLYPKYPEALNELGMVYRMQKRMPEAEKAFNEAIGYDPNWVTPYINLGSLAMVNNQVDKVANLGKKLAELNPNLGAGYFYSAAACLSAGNLLEAKQSALEAERRNHADVPQVHLVLARIYQALGDTKPYADQLRAYLKDAPSAENASEVNTELRRIK